jgi:hypothetical protein
MSRGIGIGRDIPRDIPRARGGPGAELGVQGVSIKAVPNYARDVTRLTKIKLKNRNDSKEGMVVSDFLVELNTLATYIQEEEDKNLEPLKKKGFLTALDKLERDTILKDIKSEDTAILRLFQDAQPMTHEKLTPADKTSLKQLILSFAPDILDEELDRMYPPRKPQSNINKAAKLAELLGIYMNLLERLLPTFFGALPANPEMLFIPNTTRDAQGEFVNREEALMVDLAMRAVYQYMVQIKTIGQSASAIADVVVPRTPAEFFAKFATFGLTLATLQAICPILFELLRGVATGAGLTVSDIRLIMTEAFRNAGYITAFLLWCKDNSAQITGLAWEIFSKTLGRRMPEAPPRPPNDFKALFDNLSKINTAARREGLTGVRPAFGFDLSTGLDCIVYLTRVACVAQADMMADAVRQVPRALQYLSNTCGRLAQGGVQALSRYAVKRQSSADAVSPDTYNSFGDLLSQLAQHDKYASLRANADFTRCMELMQLNNPNPHSLNEARLRALEAQDRQRFGGPVLNRRLLKNGSETGTQGDSYQDPSLLTPDHVSADQMEFDIGAAGGYGAHGDMKPPSNAPFEVETHEGSRPSDEALDLLGTIHETGRGTGMESADEVYSDDEGDDMGGAGVAASGFGANLSAASGGHPGGKPGGRGGRSRSRKRSVSKRTRRKGVAKKQKSKKNKRQSRRKVRRASSRKLHK